MPALTLAMRIPTPLLLLGLQAEALALLHWLRLSLPNVLLGVSGLSWGGTMAACVGAVFDGPIAITTIVASPNFDPLLDGALDGDIAWDRLATEQSPTAHEAARSKLR